MSNVDHPEHYTKACVTLEPIDVCRELSFDYGNAFKYICRAPYKGKMKEDLEKALWYLNDARVHSPYGSDTCGALTLFVDRSENLIFKKAKLLQKESNYTLTFWDSIAQAISIELYGKEPNEEHS
jgi:hypothetical protein